MHAGLSGKRLVQAQIPAFKHPGDIDNRTATGCPEGPEFLGNRLKT